LYNKEAVQAATAPRSTKGMSDPHIRSRTAIAVAAIGAAYAAPALCAHVPVLARALGVRRRLDDRGAVALTFDDGPHAAGTAAVLEVLRRRGTSATFFLVGEQVRRDPGLAREIVAAGHAVGLHGHRHRNLLRLTPAQVREDVRCGHAAIADVTGRAPRHYRPPYGALSATGLARARREGWETVLWSRWGRDWRAAATPQSVTADLVGHGLRGGDILLLHDADHYAAPGSWHATAAALPRVLDAIEQAGLRCATL
jgi:peptidoglycan/xylan/chitin deacetylase (PgdA/CDA1 family)